MPFRACTWMRIYLTTLLAMGILAATPTFTANWGAFKADACRGLGTRQFSSQLFNIQGSWEAACAATPAMVQGQSFSRPSRCVNQGLGGMWGEFDVRDSSCLPHWDATFQRGDCRALGFRQFSARLWDIPGGVDWNQACVATPATVQGQSFSSPSRCVNKGVGGMWGEFDVPDSSCPHWRTPFKKDDCRALGVRQFSARLWDIPQGVDWKVACAATSANVQGQSFSTPDNCVDKGIAGMWGEFGVPDTSCLPHWGDFEPAECCKGVGVREYGARLWDIPARVKWEEACPATPAVFSGQSFAAPNRCANLGPLEGEWGYFDVFTGGGGWGVMSCLAQWNSFSSSCIKSGIRQFSAQLKVPCGVEPASACKATVTDASAPMGRGVQPSRCVDNGKVGQFDVRDRCCLPSPGDVAGCAPPARPPKIVNVYALTTWANDSTYYGKGGPFELDVEHGLDNKLTIQEGGKALPATDITNPSNGTRTTQTIKDTSSDATAWTVVSRVSILPPQAGYPDGKVVTFSLFEESINPKYRGTSQQTAATEFTVGTVTKPCQVKVSAPASVMPGDQYSVTWSIQDCKQYSIKANNNPPFDSQTFNTAASSVQKSGSDIALVTTLFLLHGSNASGTTADDGATMLVACPNSPGGATQPFRFAAQCFDLCTDVTQQACDQAGAQLLVQRAFGNCTVVKDAACQEFRFAVQCDATSTGCFSDRQRAYDKNIAQALVQNRHPNCTAVLDGRCP